MIQSGSAGGLMPFPPVPPLAFCYAGEMSPNTSISGRWSSKQPERKRPIPKTAFSRSAVLNPEWTTSHSRPYRQPSVNPEPRLCRAGWEPCPFVAALPLEAESYPAKAREEVTGPTSAGLASSIELPVPPVIAQQSHHPSTRLPLAKIHRVPETVSAIDTDFKQPPLVPGIGPSGCGLESRRSRVPGPRLPLPDPRPSRAGLDAAPLTQPHRDRVRNNGVRGSLEFLHRGGKPGSHHSSR